MKVLLLREYVREVLRLFEKKEKEDGEQDNLLTEPDEAEDEDKTTELAVGGVIGAVTPLGTGSTYPDKQKKKKKKKPVYGSVVSDKRKA
jgi:hypothetical protein